MQLVRNPSGQHYVFTRWGRVGEGSIVSLAHSLVYLVALAFLLFLLISRLYTTLARERFKPLKA